MFKDYKHLFLSVKKVSTLPASKVFAKIDTVFFSLLEWTIHIFEIADFIFKALKWFPSKRKTWEGKIELSNLDNDCVIDKISIIIRGRRTG